VETKTREQVARRRFTVEEFHRMGEAGILREDERVELIEGEIVEMNPIGSPHAACVKVLTRTLGRGMDDELLLDVQNPIRLNGGLEPQPDLAVVRARERHNDPAEDGYLRMERVGKGRSLTSEDLPNLTLQLNAVLG
jgi:Uma2 family endonuclease